MSNRSMVKLIHADDFFPDGDIDNLRNAIGDIRFVQKPYGQEIENFNLIYPDIEIIFKHVLGERVTVDPKLSGVFRKPYNNAIHFESFSSLNEWCFFIALEKTVVNFWHHVDPDSAIGELEKSSCTDATMGVDYNYKNLFEWKIHTNITLEPNQALFFRPWLFHSLESGLVQYYKMTADDKYRVLVMGLPNSSKKSIATKLSEKIANSKLINSIENRIKRKDLDFTESGQMRHVYKILHEARTSESPVTIINMVTPIPKMRDILNPDFLIYAGDGDDSQYDELKEIYTPPLVYDYRCDSDDDEEIENIILKMQTKRIA